MLVLLLLFHRGRCWCLFSEMFKCSSKTWKASKKNCVTQLRKKQWRESESPVITGSDLRLASCRPDREGFFFLFVLFFFFRGVEVLVGVLKVLTACRRIKKPSHTAPVQKAAAWNTFLRHSLGLVSLLTTNPHCVSAAAVVKYRPRVGAHWEPLSPFVWSEGRSPRRICFVFFWRLEDCDPKGALWWETCFLLKFQLLLRDLCLISRLFPETQFQYFRDCGQRASTNDSVESLENRLFNS